MSKKIILILLLVVTSRCATIFNDYDEKLLENKEFDSTVKVEEIAAPAASVDAKPSEGQQEVAAAKPKETAAEKKKAAKAKTTPLMKNTVASAVSAEKGAKHEPSVEDTEGFVGRRPKVDPFVENEELTYGVSYFAVEGGVFKMKTHSFVEVNDRKSYRFTLHARSSSVFSVFYAVDDMAETFLDYEELVPYSYTIKAKESKQIRDVKGFFNWKTLQAKTWDKKIKKGKDPEERLYEWQVLPYSQNVFSAAFYLRVFQYSVGKNLSIRVGHEGKNIIMTAKVLREEKLKTAAGTLDTFVIKPEFEIDGVFKPVGDIFMWITNDQYHRIARIESKIKIGKVVVELQKISP